MTGAEDCQFSVPLQGPENKWHFSGFVVALNVGSAEKNRITSTRTHIPFAAVNWGTNQFTDSNTSVI
jgi:hypothetical protein